MRCQVAVYGASGFCRFSTISTRRRPQPCRQGLGHYDGRRCTRVCGTPSRNTNDRYMYEEVLELDGMDLEDLRSSMDEAIVDEEYEKAAFLRDKIHELENNDPVLSLERELKLAVEEERYDDAARLRDEIAVLKPPQIDQIPPSGGLQSRCRSTRTTEGVEVEVQSMYVPQHNRMTGGYMFAYKIHITNKAHPTTIKLVSRRWEITDAKGRVKVVDGTGVIGQQPELSPGETFTYQSVCPLETSTGRMRGHFEMYSRASPDSSWNTSFLVDVGEFQFDIDGPSTFE